MKSLIFLTCLVFTSLAMGNPVPNFPFVIVTESIEKRVNPDLAIVQFNLLSFDESSEKSLISLRKVGTNLLGILKKHGVPVSALESTQIDKTTKRARRDGAYSLEILGYETSQGFKLRLKDLAKYPELMVDLVALDGLEQIDAVFETTEEEKYKKELIEDLSKKARAKAEALATAQSKKIKGVYGITTEGSFGQAYAIFTLEYAPTSHGLAYSAGRYEMDLTMMVPEFIEVRQRITAIYELR